ncbi:MAG: MgtC/SapB family protein [Anaerolineae bacterium]|nr:MgtC/SapB family protein [Anaerolineae bacterium]
MTPTPMPTLDILFLRFGLALVLGFLIGLEREREKDLLFAGMRTFALISLLGATVAFASQQFVGPWLMIVGFLIISAFALVSHIRGAGTGHIGITTEVAFLLAYLMGALVYWDMLVLAAAMTVVVVLVLTFKPNLQDFLQHVEREDLWAGLEFAVVWVIVLPILPDQTYGPLDVLNPREIWLMVVIVAGLSLAAYILSHLFGMERGIGMTGILGGMISSTAVTFDFARRSQDEKQRAFSNLFALAIAIASAGMFVRVVVLTLLINSTLGIILFPPMLAGCMISLLGVALLWWQIRRQPEADLSNVPSQHIRSPFALRPALQFGLIFAVVLLISRAAQVYLNETGVYLSGLLGGLGGLDAVALSMARLSRMMVSETVAMRGITLGAASNMLFKGAVAVILGTGEVRKKIFPLFALAAAVSVAVAFLI